ncbi:ATP-binding protein [Xanthobacter versatilis]|uniref:Putative anti-sigma regulatory factor, serine/threonine protein kinase n=1 Tax=Xanthobacter autotrophicus (strain ATCC BAA-1158 / Py2) TaxID=78245 RepID=A7IIC6_XANP2|nr:putative anti-sigma regulatory factor, serine/threonine protein kinase [Xanthobacter autotrophicus Py2]
MPALLAESLISSLDVEARIDDITKATGWLGALAEDEGWSQATQFALELSLEEALTNVVSYGFQDSTVVPHIRIECYRLPEGRVAVRLIDNGVAFDPTTIAEPEVPASIEDAKIGGHGVQLMRNFLETLAYAREGGENHLTLIAGKPD